MKKYLIALLIILPVVMLAQEEEQETRKIITLEVSGSSSNYHLKDAPAMAAAGEYVYISYGIAPAFNPGFNSYVLKEYGITVISNGCMTSAGQMATASAFKKEIEKKYGEHFMHDEFEKFKKARS
ncbi:hypothetical protein [Nonlabens ponticola]|uniref:Uncharacterized protein n=1 Tax=Nonlabens ponticola TaxID=2496866 RepID=A0A3S9N0Q6_9FLAO|nr:hypothetical protein [Nonlabens ponticola]AZQ44912.1 hypothetical protein EJ995_12005 [Nonlabens ponticola]